MLPATNSLAPGGSNGESFHAEAQRLRIEVSAR